MNLLWVTFHGNNTGAGPSNDIVHRSCCNLHWRFPCHVCFALLDYKYHLLIVGAVVLVLVIVIAMSIVGYRRIKYVAQVKSDQACLQHRSVSSYGSKSTITSDLTDKRNYSGSGE